MVTKEGLRNWCRGKIATIKIPQEIELTDHFPISATGKISKGQLRSLAREHLEGRGPRQTEPETEREDCGRRKRKNCGRRKRNQEDCGGQIGRQLSLVRGPERQERTVWIHGKNHNSERGGRAGAGRSGHRFGSQGMTGWPEEIGLAIENRFMETGHPSGITHIHGAGQGDFGRMSEDGKTCRGSGALAHDGLLSCSIHGHVGCSFKVTKQIVDNKILHTTFPWEWWADLAEMGRGFPRASDKGGTGHVYGPEIRRGHDQ